jgi:hypothetical protein
MVDRIVVIADGQISEMGTYRELISRDGPFAQLLHTLAQEDSPTDDESDESKHFICEILYQWFVYLKKNCSDNFMIAM